MERNTLTTLDRLALGDRFYKHGDNGKHVMCVVTTRKTLFRSQVYTIIAPPGQSSESVLSKIIKSPANYKVVFLRNENDAP